MAQQRSVRVVGEQTNGHANGAVQHFSSPAEARRVITLLSLFGSRQDARNLYFAQDGTGSDGWEYLERVMDPVRRYVIDGDAPYVQPLGHPEQYEGLRTPPGDCQGDLLPFEEQNQERELVKAGMRAEGELP
jgi:hypothetical protein